MADKWEELSTASVASVATPVRRCFQVRCHPVSEDDFCKPTEMEREEKQEDNTQKTHTGRSAVGDHPAMTMTADS